MPELAYVNGVVTPIEEAKVSVEDRGFQFADGVYEVARAHNRKLVDLDRHLERLERSARMLDLPLPMPVPELARTCLDFFRQSAVAQGVFYLQLSRGASKRQHAAPPGLRPTLVMTAREYCPPPPGAQKAITVPNNRWKLCSCKSTALVATVLAKHAAVKAGADEAIFVEDDGTVLEGASSNIFVAKDGVVHTAPADGRILEGITRSRVLELAAKRGIRVVAGRVPVELLRSADEVFLTGSVLTVVPFVAIDGRPVGNGEPGPVATALGRDYWDFVREATA